MTNQELRQAFAKLATPQIADACVRLDVPVRSPRGVHCAVPGRIAGRVLPVRHYGSVDIFLEVLDVAEAGDALVVDNGGLDNEGCIGDLTVLEAHSAGVSGIVVWGRHRDTDELHEINLPVFSCGSCLVGPVRADTPATDAKTTAHIGDFSVTKDDVTFADVDGVIFVPHARISEIIDVANTIRNKERQQADLVADGQTLRVQLQFDVYKEKRAADPAYTFRKHLREIGGAIEE
jgi:regulator of RNase E activity RraA